MKRIVSLILTAALLLGLLGSAALAETPTLRVLTILHSEQTAGVEDLYIFKYLAEKFNVKFELEAVDNGTAGERATQLLLSDDVFDLMWVGIGTGDIMRYGVDAEELLDWTPYLNEETMPNACKAREA